ncbi:MAG: metallophosphatase domain-containing protein [Candidatus Eremiobacterota bacterium]
MRLVLLSDTHALHTRLAVPEGDILLHAGDLTRRGELEDVESFNRFLEKLPHRHKVVIAGNHDFCFERDRREAQKRLTAAVYLQDEAVTLEGLKIYGSPWQPWFYDWAFNLPRGEPLREKWARIPEGTDILITHGPPHGILDRTYDGRLVGCEELKTRVEELRPRLHLFGHIHEAYGVHTEGPTTYVNACVCDMRYRPIQAPIVLDWGRRE